MLVNGDLGDKVTRKFGQAGAEKCHLHGQLGMGNMVGFGIDVGRQGLEPKTVENGP